MSTLPVFWWGGVEGSNGVETDNESAWSFTDE